MLEMLRVWCPSREPCPCGVFRLAPQGVRATTASFSHLSSITSTVFSLLPDSCASGGHAQLAVAVNRPEPISQREHLILCAMAKAEPTSPASRLAAEGCREGGEDLSALSQVAVAGRCCWMAWISSRSAVRQTVGVSWVRPVPGGARAEQSWAGCRCPLHLGAVVLLCRKWFFHCLEAAGLGVPAVVFEPRDPHWCEGLFTAGALHTHRPKW